MVFSILALVKSTYRMQQFRKRIVLSTKPSSLKFRKFSSKSISAKSPLNLKNIVMRNLLLFVGSCLYPVVMVIISPLLAFLYVLLGMVVVSRYLKIKTVVFASFFNNIKLPSFHFSMKKQISFLPKGLRLH